MSHATRIAAVAIVTIALSSSATAVAAQPATAVEGTAPVAAEPGTPAVTAEVRSINHGLGIVTLDGTAPPRTAVEVTGEDVVATRVESGDDGTWTARVQVRPGGERLLRITPENGPVIELPVDVLILRPPEMIASIDGLRRTIDLQGTGHPGAHVVLREASGDLGDPEGGVVLDETDVDRDGSWSSTLRDLSFGEHHVEAWMYFDGEHNGGVDEVYSVSGAAVLATSEASRETGLITLAGRAPADTTLGFADDRGPVTDPDGRPVSIRVSADLGWRVELPIPPAARFHRVTVTTLDGGAAVGTIDARVTVPIQLTGTATDLPDGTVRLAGTGEPGGTVTLEREGGEALLDAAGEPVRAVIGRRWEITVPRTALPDEAVVVRQRIGTDPQGAVRLRLSVLPGRPDPEGPDVPGSGGAEGAESVPTTPGAAGSTRSDRTAGRTGRLATTGADLTVPLGAAGGMIAAGLGVLVGARARRRRPTPVD